MNVMSEFPLFPLSSAGFGGADERTWQTNSFSLKHQNALENLGLSWLSCPFLSLYLADVFICFITQEPYNSHFIILRPRMP